MFTDRAKLRLRAGKGGNGIVAWRREKYVPKGGPCGGNGGRGGSVIFRVDPELFSLDWFRDKRFLKAENGRDGGPNKRTGRGGKDIILKVPPGTLIKDIDSGEVLRDLTEKGEEWAICVGGKGGRGNETFKSPTNQAPNTCTPGKPGQECRVELELKLIADIGLIGFPNAGKSTLLGALTKARVKIAAYPFTTLHPNLGYIEFGNYSRTFIADIPGIIEGAHQNRGLGFEFLRHIERTKMLVYVLDASGIDGRTPSDDLQVLRQEMKKYNPQMLERPSLVILNKIDSEEAEQNIQKFKEELPHEKTFQISALEKIGLEALLEELSNLAS